MLAAWLAILLTAELAALGLLAQSLLARGCPVGASVGACVALAIGWRAVLVGLLMVLARVHRGLDATGAVSRFLGWATLWVHETAVMARAYLTMTFEPLRVQSRALAARADDPLIVMVHGWLCNAGLWRPLIRRLRRLGLENICNVTLRPVLGSIDTMAAALDEAVSPLRAAAPGRPVVLVTHSTGGLVARRWLQRLDTAARGSITLITIGCPHGGTRIARLGLGAAARQMRLGSAWLADLNADERGRGDVICIASRTDDIVTPQENAQLPGAQAVVVPAVGHFGLLAAGATVECVMEACRGAAARPGS
jgi:triacylglycerol lipase